MKTLLFAFLILPAFAAADCLQSATATDLVRCAINDGAEVQIQKLTAESARNSAGKAGQWKNPEADFETVSDGNGNQNVEASLLFDFEVFGKRGARARSAAAEYEIADKRLQLTKGDVAVALVTHLYRLRQIETEKNLVEEAAETFTNVTKPYKNRSRLNPEQEVSLSVFEIAADENQMKLSHLIQERREIENDLRSSFKGQVPLESKLLPPLKTEWPPIKSAENASVASQILAAEEKKAQALLESEKAESWPELKLGPKYVREGREDSQVGIAIAMSVPIFSLNGSGRASAQSNLSKVRLENEFARRRIQNQRDNLNQIYVESSAAILRSVQNSRFTKKHQSLHRLLNQGLINASLVIELHRQLYDYQRALHEQELNGVSAYWKLLALDDRLLEGEVK